MARAAFFDRILEAGSLDDVRQGIGDTLIGERLGAAAQRELADTTVRQAYRGIAQELRGHSPSPDVAELVLCGVELRSLKNFIKRRHLGMEASTVASRYGEGAWERIWAGLEVELPPLFAGVVASARAAFRAGPAQWGLFDAAFDSASLRTLCDEAERIGCAFIVQYYRRFDAVKGIELLWRARMLGLGDQVQDVLIRGRQDRELFASLRRGDLREWPAMIVRSLVGMEAGALAPESEAQAVRAFVRAADAWLMDFARQAQRVAFGPERVFGCLVGLDAEAHNVAMAVVGRARGISASRLRGHLRACYV